MINYNSSKLTINLTIIITLCILVLLIYILFLIFGIINLVSNNYSIKNVWYYLLVSVIQLVISKIMILFSSKEDDYLYQKIIIIILFYIGNIVWGGYTLSNYDNTTLYKIALAYWILSLFIVSMCTVYFINYKKKEEVPIDIKDFDDLEAEPKTLELKYGIKLGQP